MIIRSAAVAAALGLALMIGAVGPVQASTRVAIFAGGCFWSTESDFDKMPGVLVTTSGYIGGKVEHPTYDQVVTETTGHREAVRITYDPQIVSFRELVNAFFSSIDPFDPGGQMYDRGESYTTAIYATSERQFEAAETVKTDNEADLGAKIVTVIDMAPEFYPAEDYHQNYYEKNPEHYLGYREASGRFERVSRIWGDRAYSGFIGIDE